MIDPARPRLALALLAAVLLARTAAAEDPAAPAPAPRAPLFTDADILAKPPPLFRLDSVAVRYTRFDQSGTGYQSRAGKPGGPGSEEMRVDQPQLEVVIKQGAHLTHRVWIPVDVVTAASPDAIDVVSTSSRRNEAASVDWTATYAKDHTTASIRNGHHEEENYRSWNTGLALTQAFAEDNTVVSAGMNVVLDWFDRYLLSGTNDGHNARSSLNFNAGLTQLLSPTTIAHVDYGYTQQEGQLSNGWNIVPTPQGAFQLEKLPGERGRHAFVGRIAQHLPWNGAVHGSYRFYVDTFGIVAHTFEVELHQRLAAFARIRFNYRYHTQTGADFFRTSIALGDPGFATADSDLAPLHAHTIGFKGTFDFPVKLARTLHADLAVERYFRSNDLRVSVYSCGLGLLF
ncbi:MAG: DUF3570 domain-containing protein [Byssovorax sp.]